MSKKFICLALTFVLLLTSFGYANANNGPLVEGSYLEIKDGYISKIPAGVTESELVFNFVDGADVDNPTNIVTTGTEVTLDGNTYKAIVMADINGDGEVNTADYLNVKGSFKGIVKLSKEAKLAADTNGDGIVSSSDYIRVKRHIADDINLYEGMNILPPWNGVSVRNLDIAGVDIEEYVIVRSENGDATIKKSATELQKYIKEATGVELPVKDESSQNEYEICVGSTDRDTAKVQAATEDLYNNGIAIVYDNNKLYLTGKTSTGAMYSVYTFLEDNVGWRFYSSKYEDVKLAGKISVPSDINISYSPKIMYRDPLWYDLYDGAFAAKIKVNGVDKAKEGYGEFVDYACGLVHTLGGLSGVAGVDNQPCLTDPQVYETVLNNVLACLRANPDAKIISVSQNDSHPGVLGCQCENCKAIDEAEGSPAGTMITFVNKIAEAIEDEFPNVYVDTLAYHYTRKPPKNVKPRDNVVVRLCTSDCCTSHSFGVGCETNRFFEEDFEGWSEICDRLYIWDYTTNFGYYVNPFPNLKVLYDKITYFADNNVVGMLSQGNYQSYSGEFEELRAYLVAKLLWNPDMTKEEYLAHMDDFLQGYYGAGWKYIREYIDLTSAQFEKGCLYIRNPIDEILHFDSFATSAEKKAFVAKLTDLWDSALALTDEERYDNVKKSALQGRYASLSLIWSNKTGPADLEQLHLDMLHYNIGMLNEGLSMYPVGTVSYYKKLSEWK